VGIALVAASSPPAKPSPRLVVRSSSSLAAPVQDAAASALDGSHLMLAGGLTAADLSSPAIQIVSGRSDRLVGQLPGAVHDAAAVLLGRDVYVFGGGNGLAQLDGITRIDRSGRTTSAGRLPAPSSDQAAAGIGNTAYVVGGYTGTRWLDTIVAWGPRTSARVVAHLPTPVRYAAVTAVAGRLLIAGGSLPNGNASRAVYTYTPGGRVLRVATLATPTTHAAAAALGGTAFVLGGRGASAGTPTARIVAVDLGQRRTRPAGRLPQALSDLAAAQLANRIVVVGGRGLRGTVATVTQLAKG